MDALAVAPDGPLPDDVPALQALLRQALAELVRLRAENAELRGKLDAALKHRFGRRSERRPASAGAKANGPGRARPDLWGMRPAAPGRAGRSGWRSR